MTEDLFFPARWQQKRSLPSLRVDNSTSGKITHYCFGVNSGKMAQSLKAISCILFRKTFFYWWADVFNML